jgi:hypothetical protein
MVRLLQCGWETGDVAQLGVAVNPSGTFPLPTVVSATPTARSGTYCLKCAAAATGGGWNTSSKVNIKHASKTELYYAFSIYRNDSEPNTLPSRASFYTADTASNVNTVLMTESDGTVRAYVATAGGSNPSSFTLIGLASGTIPGNAWTNIEVHLIAATGATGTCEVKINGATVLSVATVRTCQTNANFGNMGLQFARISNATGGASTSYLAFDDLRVNDTTGSVNTGWCGDEKILMLTPSAAGDSSQFSRGGADSGNNWGQVDDTPPNALTDYVYDTVTGHLDLYNTPTVTVVSVSAVEVLMQAFNVDGSGGSINLVTKSPAGQSDGGAQNLTGTPQYLHRLLDTDPADSAAWTQAKINDLQVGPKVAS